MKKLRLLTLLLALISLGYIRDLVFIPLNEIIDAGSHSLEALKWVFTLVFSALYLGLALSFANAIFKTKTHQRTIVLFYLVFVLSGTLAYGAGTLFGDPLTGYTIARRLMGMVQSPILIMILIPAFYLKGRQK